MVNQINLSITSKVGLGLLMVIVELIAVQALYEE